jgi:hypothetical protein
MNSLLEAVAAQGWSAQSREEFVRRYDREIGETILHLLVEYGLLADRRALRSLKSYIENRLRDRRAGEEDPLWEIVEEVYLKGGMLVLYAVVLALWLWKRRAR